MSYVGIYTSFRHQERSYVSPVDSERDALTVHKLLYFHGTGGPAQLS